MVLGLKAQAVELDRVGLLGPNTYQLLASRMKTLCASVYLFFVKLGY